MSRGMLIILAMLAGGLVAGCAAQGARSRFQERTIQSESEEQVLQVAEALLRREFRRVTRGEGERLVTVPMEYTTTRDSGAARDLYGGRSTMRRTATFELGRRGGRLVARLRVDIEREDADRRPVMRPQGHRITDAPADETPLMADAATTSDQNTIWTFVRRDTSLERALLVELQEHFTRMAADSGVAESGGEPASGQTVKPAPAERPHKESN